MPSLKTNKDGSPHIHTYVRAKDNSGKKRRDKYKCDDPLCSHVAFKYQIEGKKSLCSKCRTTEIILNYDALQRSRPACFNCGESKKAKSLRAKVNVLEDIFGDADANPSKP